MTGNTTDDATDRGPRVIASTTYKLLGELDDGSGAGVLGRNTASSGTPIGVEGATPDADGYGLSTPEDASVGGTAELGALTGGLTGDQRVTDLLGPGLALDSGTLTATPARLDVDDGTTGVDDVEAISFARGLSVTDDGDGSATVDRGDDA